MQSAFAALVAAEHWRERNAARGRLGAFGEDAFETILAGTRHAKENVRIACHEILRTGYPSDGRALTAILAGLDDESRWHIAYPSAFHIGQYHLEAGRERLRAVLADEVADDLTRNAAAKSLGELGEVEATVWLWSGLGSDDAYARYLSNLGLRGLTDRDLTDFDYEGPWEGAFVSGPAVGSVQGQPLEKARKRVRRWQAIVAYTEWLEDERPELFAELESKLW